MRTGKGGKKMFEISPEYTLETMRDDIATQRRLICFAVAQARKNGEISNDCAAQITRRLERIADIVNDYIAEH